MDYRIVGGPKGTVVINQTNYSVSGGPGALFGLRCNTTDLKKDGTYAHKPYAAASAHALTMFVVLGSGIFVDTESKNVSFFHAELSTSSECCRCCGQ